MSLFFASAIACVSCRHCFICSIFRSASSITVSTFCPHCSTLYDDSPFLSITFSCSVFKSSAASISFLSVSWCRRIFSKFLFSTILSILLADSDRCCSDAFSLPSLSSIFCSFLSSGKVQVEGARCWELVVYPNELTNTHSFQIHRFLIFKLRFPLFLSNTSLTTQVKN